MISQHGSLGEQTMLRHNLQLLYDASMIRSNETWRLAELTSSTRKLINKLGLS
jgi:hypothetical protein